MIVYWCSTQEEADAHAKAGHCISISAQEHESHMTRLQGMPPMPPRPPSQDDDEEENSP
jgi:hypothetical protein